MKRVCKTPRATRGRWRRWILAVPIICLAAVVLVLPMACNRAGGDRVVITVGSNLPEDHPSSQAITFFKNRLEELSEGKVHVRAFFNSQLGSQSEVLESTQGGNIQMAFISVATMAGYVPELNVLNLPFLFRDKQHEYAVLTGEVAREMEKAMAERNLHTLGYFDAGFRSLMTKRGPIRTPDDVRGMKLRVIPGQLMAAFASSIGASPTSMDQGEVYTALQMGMLDGWENNPPTCASFRMWETGCIYYARTEHLSLPDMLLMNKAFYDGLPPELREQIDQVASETTAKQRELWKQGEAASLKQMEESGMRFNDVDRAAFEAKTESVYALAYERYGERFRKLVEMIKATQ